MTFQLRTSEWAIIANGQDSPIRMDGHRGCVVTGPDGQMLDVWEQAGKIHVEIHELAELDPLGNRIHEGGIDK